MMGEQKIYYRDGYRDGHLDRILEYQASIIALTWPSYSLKGYAEGYKDGYYSLLYKNPFDKKDKL